MPAGLWYYVACVDQRPAAGNKLAIGPAASRGQIRQVFVRPETGDLDLRSQRLPYECVFQDAGFLLEIPGTHTGQFHAQQKGE
jgi:hypothetical protein